jgi:hypothetical protein
VERVTVRLAVDGNRTYPQFFTGADNAKSDLASIGDEQFAKHRFHSGPVHPYSCCHVYDAEGANAAGERRVAGRTPLAGRW